MARVFVSLGHRLCLKRAAQGRVAYTRAQTRKLVNAMQSGLKMAVTMARKTVMHLDSAAAAFSCSRTSFKAEAGSW